MKKLDKMRMVRAADAFLPLGLLTASLWRSDMAENLFFTRFFPDNTGSFHGH